MPVGMPPRAATLPLLYVEGNWSEAIELATVTRTGGTPLERQMAVTILAGLAYHQGNIDQAWEMVRELIPRGPDSQPEDALFPYAMETLRLATRLSLDAGDTSGACSWLQAHDRWLEWSGAVRGRAESDLLWAHIHRVEENVEDAESRAHEALRRATDPRQPLVLLATCRLLGRLDMDCQRYEDAEMHLWHARSLADDCAAPHERARTLLEMAELRLLTGKLARAEPLLDEVRRVAGELRAKPLTAAAENLAGRISEGDANASQLTGREIEVLRYVAEGLTDAEVADRLFISPRTVGQHLRSVYNKLGVSSRTQATRVAVQDRLI